MDDRKRLQNLADAMVDDIMDMTDEEVWQEFVKECGSLELAENRMKKINMAFENMVSKAKAKANDHI